MKKKNRVLSFALIALAAITGFTCKQNIGMGETVNIYSPNGGISYPDAGETPIRGSFVLQGTANDGDGIKSISVVFKNIETEEESKAYKAEGFTKGDTDVSWTINVDNESTGVESGHELVKLYPIPDGEYTAIVSVTDMGDKTSTFTKNYKIDNTPPVFIVSRPPTVVAENAPATPPPPQADGYGAIFSVVGQAGEKNTVEKLQVLVPNEDIDITKMFVGNNINVQVAVAGDTSSPKEDLYALQRKDKTKPIRGVLYLYDNARGYKGGDAVGEGNKADWYYQWDAIHTDVIAKGYTSEVISDYFAGKKGSNSSKANDHDRKIYELRKDTVALAKLQSAMIKMNADNPAENQRCTFKLDPSISPGFKVIGSKNLPKSSLNLGNATSMLFKPGSETAFSVELIRNKDNTPLVGGSTLGAYTASDIEIILQKWNKASGTNEVESFKNDENLTEVSLLKFSDLTEEKMRDLITVENGKLRVKCVFPTSQDEGFYAVKVKGTDTIKKDTHKFVAYDDSNTANDGTYILNFLAIGTGPRPRAIRPEGFKKAGAKFIIAANVTGVDATNGHVYCNIGTSVSDSDIELKKASPVASDPRYEVEVEIVEVSGKYVIKWKDPAGTAKQKELPSGFSDGTHTIKFLAKVGSGSTDTDETDFVFDTKAPEINAILSPDLTKNQSGDFTMRGSVSDTSSGVKSIKYIVGKQNSTNIEVQPAENDTKWKAVKLSGDNWSIDFTGSNNITNKTKAPTIGKKVGSDELYDIPIFFLVEDKAAEKDTQGGAAQKGNTAIITKVLRVDPNGDIPIVTVSTPDANQVLGGTIRISGLVNVPDPSAGQVGSMWIQITDKKDGSDNPDFTQSALFGSVDWCPNPDGKQLSSTGTNPEYKTGGSYWSVEINANKEFEPSSGTQRDIWFRLRGKNNKTSPVAGQWTAPVKITVDKAAPTITSMKVATEAKIGTAIPSSVDPENQTYVSNMWIKGDALYLCADLAHNAGIEQIDISGSYFGASTITLKDDSQITGSNINRSGKAWFTQSSAPSATTAKNYKMRIPLKTTTNPGGNNGFTLTVKIRAKKQGDTEGLTASTTFSFKYDNTAPTAVFGTKIASSGTVTVSGTSFTDPALIGKNIDKTMKVFTSGKDIGIEDFNKNTGTVTLKSDPAIPAKPTTGYLIYSPIEYLRPDASGKVSVVGAAYDVGSGVEKIKVNYDGVSSTEIVLESPSGVLTDVGNGDVNFVTWKGVIDVSNSAIVDGKGKIVITPIDRAHNTPTPIEAEVKLKKNLLKITGVELGTDINRNGTIADVGSTVVETKTLGLTYNAANPDGIDSEKYDWHGKADGGTFRFKNNTSQIKLGTGGGRGAKKYTLEYLHSDGKYKKVRELTALDTTGIIALVKADFDKIGQSPALNTAAPTKRKLLLTVWDSAQGLTCGKDTWKAELELDVIVDTTDRVAPTNTIDPFKWVSESENSLYGNSRKNGHIEIKESGNSQVSGKISITGTAHDDQVITEIWAKIDNFTFTGASTADAQVGHRLATYSTSTGNFTVKSGNVDTNGWKFTVVSNEFSVEKGHTIKWQLDWDSSKITGGVGLNKTIMVTVKDTGHTNQAVASREVDVVPYITEIKRPDTYNTHRSSSGAYNLLRGDTVTVEGFNLTGTIKATVQGAAAATLSGSTFTLPATAKSGKVKITVQPSGSTTAVEAINNLTNNSKPYNQQVKDNKPETKYWTDDIAIDVWKDDEQFGDSTNPKYPSMAMGSNGDLYAAFSNYSEAKVYYSKLGNSTATQVFYAYDPPEEAAISVSGVDTVNILYSANYHGGNDFDWDKSATGAGGLYCYDQNAPELIMKVATTYDPAKKGKFHRFELFYHNKQLQQFKNFRITRGNNNRIHVAYYDTLSHSIKYATVMHNASGDLEHEYPWINLDGDSDTDDTGSYTGRNSAVLGDSQFEGGTSTAPFKRSSSTAEYCAIALDGSNRPVVVYADVDTGTLRLARANSQMPMAAANWKVQKVLPAGDDNRGLASDYFAAQFDSAGYLHIVFRNTKGQICYVKSKEANQGANAYTFDKSVVIAENGSWIELTMDGATPYVAYLSKINTYDGIQIAYYDANFVKTWKADGTENEKGAWNIMAAAMQNRSSAARACIAVAPSSITDWKAAVGYTPGSVYRVVKYIGK